MKLIDLKFFVSRHLPDLVILIFLIGFSVGVFLIIRRPPPMSDPTDYFYTAQYTSWVEPTHRHMRYGLMWPLWMLQQIFGYSELSYYALPFVSMVNLSIGTFLLGRVLFNRSVGLFAALSILVNPTLVEQGSLLLPDFLSPGLFVLGFVIVLFQGKTGLLHNPHTLSSRMGLVVAGLLLGWSYLTREFILIVFPSIALLLFLYKASKQSVAWLSISFFCTLAAEMFWNFRWYGNPFMRFLVSSEPRDSSHITTDVWEILTQLPQILLERPGGWVLLILFLFATAACIWMWKREAERWGALAIWFLGGWLFFTIVGLLPVLFFDGKYTLLRTNVERYWFIIFPPMLAAGWGAMYIAGDEILHRVELPIKQYLFYVVAIPLFFISMLGGISTLDNFRYIRNGHTDYQEFRSFLGQYGDDYQVLWLNQPGRYTSVRTIPIYLNEWHGLDPIWRGQIEFYNTDSEHYLPLSSLTKGLLVLDLSDKDGLNSNHDLPDYLLDLSLLGEPIFESSHETVLAFKLPP